MSMFRNSLGVLFLISVVLSLGVFAQTPTPTPTPSPTPIAVTGDSRTLTEPVFPPVCTALKAAQPANSSMDETQETADTTSIQNAINSCYAVVQACASTSSCPTQQAVELQADGANNAFIIKPITLKAGVVLLIDAEVTLFASVNPGDYASNSSTLITGSASNSGIMGYGVIDGRGGWIFPNTATRVPTCNGSPCTSWWAYGAATGGERPRLVGPSGTGLTFYKVTIQNAPMFHYTASGSNQTIWGIKITAPGSGSCNWQAPDTGIVCNAANTDGLDPTGTTTNLTVTNSWISDGDDNVAVKAGGGFMQNFTFSHNHFFQGHGMSIGSQTNTGINNMLVTDLVSDGTNGGGQYSLKIKSYAGSGGLSQNIKYDGVCILNGGHNMAFDPYYSGNYGTTKIPQMYFITMHNVHALTGGTNYLRGYRYSAAGVLSTTSYPLSMTFDNVIFDQDTNLTQQTHDFIGTYNSTAFVDNANFTVGPGPVSFAPVLQSLAGTSFGTISVTQDPNYPDSSAPYDCTGRYIDLAAELFSPAGATVTGTTVSLTAILQPIVFGRPVPTGTLTLYEVNQGGSQTQIGTPQAVGGAINSYPGSNHRAFTYLSIPNVTAGTHVYTVQYSGDSNYSTTPSWRANYPGLTVLPTFPQVTVTVIPGAPTTTTVSPTATSLGYGASVTYNATVAPQSGSVTPTGTVTFTDSVGGHLVAQADVSLSSGAAAWTYVPSAGAHTVIATYNGQSGVYLTSSATDTTLTVSPATVSASVTAANKTYDGTTAATITGCTLAGIVGSDDVGCTATGTFAAPNANTGSTVTATVSLTGTTAGNYTLASTTATTTADITTATPTVTVTCPSNVTYDGAAHACTAAATGVGGAAVNGTFGWSPAASETAAGSYPLTATFTSSNSNYSSGAQGSGTLVIATATPVVTVTCAPATYDGNAHGCTAAAAGVGGPVTGTFSWSPAQSETAAGNYTITATFTSSDANYSNGAQGTGSLAIARATVTPSVTAANKAYDGGTSATITGCTLTSGVIGADSGNVTCTAAAAAFLSANANNGVTVTATGITLGGSAAPNYVLSTTSAVTTANIGKATPVVSVTCPGPVTYDGAAHGCTAAATGIGGAAVTGSMVITYNGSATAPSAKGNYTVVATFTSGDGNYTNGTPATGSLSIVAVVPVVTVTCPAGVVYDGNVHGCTAAATASGSPITGSFAWNPASLVHAGTYTVTATFTPDDQTDYGLGATGSASLVIAKAAPVVTVTCAPVTYDGSAHGCTATAAGVLADGHIAGTYSWSPANATAAGSYPMTATFTSGNTDYSSGAQGTGSLVIARATVTAGVTAANKTYDGGTVATISGCSLTSGVIGADSGNLTCTAAGGTFGSANVANGITVTANGITLGGTAAVNYLLSATTATTTANINKATPTLALTCTTVTYDAQPHTCTGAATGVGSATVSGTFAMVPATITAATTGTSVTGTFTSSDGNYASGGTATGSLIINKKPVTATVTANNKNYDGTNTEPIGQTACNPNVLGADTASVTCAGTAATFSQINAGTGLTVTVTGITLGGSGAVNYTLSGTTATATANIIGVPVTTTITALNKVYDATATEPLASVTCATSVSDPNLTCAATAASFSQTTVGTGLTVTATGITLGGSTAGGYTLNNTTATATAAITARPAAIAGNPASKVYGTSDPALLTATLTNFISTDNVTYTCTRQTGEAVGTYPINCTPASSALGNYTVTSTPGVFTILAPTPTISSLTPANVQAGSAAFTLTINGTNFQSTATVLWNGTTTLTPATNTGTQLTVLIPATAITSSGTVSVQVVNPLPTAAPSAAFTFAIDSAASVPGIVTVTTTATITPVQSATGGSVNVPFTLSGANSTSITTATCYNLPTGVTCSYANGVLTVTVPKGTKAGAYAITVVFQTTQTLSASLLQGRTMFAAWSGILGLPLGLIWIGGRKKNLRRVLMVVAGMVVLATLVGCGGKSMSTATPTTTQTSTTVSVIVQ